MRNYKTAYHYAMWRTWLAAGNLLRRIGSISLDRGWELTDGPARRHFYKTEQGQKMIAEAGGGGGG